MKISKAKRAHLLALWAPRARAQEQREKDRATSEAWLREVRLISRHGFGVLPQDAMFEIISFDSAGGPMALFKAEMDRAGVAIAMALLGSTP